MPDWMKTPEQQQAEQESAELARRFTYKTDIWTRCTEDEAEILDARLEQAPARERRMWADSLSVQHASDYYTMLREQMEAEFGVERTAAILAPSTEV